MKFWSLNFCQKSVRDLSTTAFKATGCALRLWKRVLYSCQTLDQKGGRRDQFNNHSGQN